MNVRSNRVAACAVAAIAAVVVVLVLQGDDPTAAPDVTTVATPAPMPSDLPSGLSGTWSGTFTIVTPSESTGTMQVTLVQQGSQLSGSMTAEGASCFGGGGFQGLITGTEVELGLLQRDEVEFEGTLDGDIMTGTVSIACDSSDGTWTLSRQP